MWAGIWANNVTSIYHYPLTGFDANGAPSWGTPIVYAVPSTIAPLGRVIYLPDSDTLILAQAASSTAWNQLGTRVEVYHGWLAGNRTPSPVITLTKTNPKTITASGNYAFVGYVHTVPDIDAFNLTTGALDLTMTSTNGVYVGNDIDSMYGLRSYLRSTGQYVVTKDDYNATSVVVYRWTP